MPTTVAAGSSVVDTIIQVAQSLGVDPRLAVAIAQNESGLNPQAVGDNGSSFGLYQLHQGGELGSMSPQQAFDPTTNAVTALTVVAEVAHAHPDWSPGQIAAAAQRPANQAVYADSVNALYNHLPSNIPALASTHSSAVYPGQVSATSGAAPTQPGLFHVDTGVLGNVLQMVAGGVLVLFGANLIVKDLTGASPFGAVARVVERGATAIPGAGPVVAASRRRTVTQTRQETSRTRQEAADAREARAQEGLRLRQQREARLQRTEERRVVQRNLPLERKANPEPYPWERT